MNLSFFLFLSLSLPSFSQTLLIQKGGWKQGDRGNATTFWDPSCTHPQVVVEEDFTDSSFNGYNAGVNGVNWQFFAAGVAYRKPNNRSTFPLAVSRNPFISAGGWAGVLWGNKINPALGHSDPNLVEYKIDKKDDIFITRFRAFSDFSHRNERAGVEVANMETRNVLCPDPDYCHDLSFEAKQNFYSRPQDDLQLETNVENTTDRSPFGARRTHYNNLTTKANLNREYTNLVVWRNDPIKRKSNIEQWGELNYGDFWLDTHMVSKLDPSNRYAIVSEVQVSIFAGDTNFILYRDSIDKQKAQIGILNVHSGISKRSDFNLDYRTNDLDVAILKQYLGRNDSATIRRGDANNDTKITGEDCNAVAAFWSDSTSYPDSAFAKAIYSPIPNPFETGTFSIQLKNLNYLSIKAPSGSSVVPASNSLSQTSDVYFQEPTTGNLYFFSKTGFSLENETFNFSTNQTGITADQVVFTVNYMGSCQSPGFSFTTDSVFTMTETAGRFEQTQSFQLPGKTIFIPASAQNLEMIVTDITGKTFDKKSGTKEFLEESKIKFPSGVAVCLIRNLETGQVIAREKVYQGF